MNRFILLFCLISAIHTGLNAQTLNGQLDDIKELSTRTTIPITMPDGISLMTDIYQPILQDCVMVDINIPLVNSVQKLMLLPRGKQIIMYDSVNGQPNPNPYQLPMIFSRTPYKKGDSFEGSAPVNLLGYTFAYQDMRGRYTSEGVYMPLYSDGWNKNPYHPEYGHILDVTPLSDPRNGNKHEDGYNSVQAILNTDWQYDLDGDGIKETTDKLTNGRIAMFGASALGYNQYQAAAAHRIDPNQPGLKCLLPIVATQEFYKSTGYHNGVFRDQLVTGWLKGQIFTGTDDDLNAIDTDIDNNLHSSTDYGLPNKFEAANRAIDHFAKIRYQNGPAGYYPNSIGRVDMDASRAPVNELGEGDKNGQFSRYTNMEVPMYHLTGWWDIFIDGQIETWQLLKKHLNPQGKARNMQKMVIGPWAHQTIGGRKTGNLTYPPNVGNIIGFSLDDFNSSELPLSQALQSEIIGWYRYNLNYDTAQFLGEPKARIPKSDVWQNVTIAFAVKFPEEDYIIPLDKLLAFVNGTGGLPGLKIRVRENLFNNETSFTIDIPALGSPLISGLDQGNISAVPFKDFTQVPNFRMYIPGPVDDGIAENATVGNYWFESDTFPLRSGIRWENYYLHKNGSLNNAVPITDEGFKMYVHDPNDPVRTVGGGNMIEKYPDGSEVTQGQCDLIPWTQYTMDREGVIQFETAVLDDTLSILGYPEATIYAKSNPAGVQNGPTDTDFFVRIIDVYPDGRELFVSEGAVNARARLYARSLLDNNENDNALFENINIGEIYEYAFRMYPIGYTFGKQHKIKILISSSNYTRFQVNPNLPINDGEFFRRKPGDGQTYVFNGVEMAPRVAVNRIHFSPEHATRIKLPVLDPNMTSVQEHLSNSTHKNDFLIYPNPVSSATTIYIDTPGDYILKVLDAQGKLVYSTRFQGDQYALSTDALQSGIYLIDLRDYQNKTHMTQRLIKQ